MSPSNAKKRNGAQLTSAGGTSADNGAEPEMSSTRVKLQGALPGAEALKACVTQAVGSIKKVAEGKCRNKPAAEEAEKAVVMQKVQECAELITALQRLLL